MKIMYLNNFRGFTDTFIPFMTTNFLVGENSTGKSSVLAAINLLHDQNFYTTTEFNTGEHELGTFSDIASVAGRDSDSFTIGIYRQEIRKSEKRSSQLRHMVLLSFRNQGEVPTIHKYSYIEGNCLVRIVLEENRFSFRVERISRVPKPNDNPLDQFRKITEIHHEPPKNFAALPADIPHHPMLIFFGVPVMIQKASKKISQSAGHHFVGPTISSEETHWIAPIRSKPRRTYDTLSIGYTPEGDHIPHYLRGHLNTKADNRKFRTRLNQTGKQGGLFDEIKIKRYGTSEFSPFEVKVRLGKETCKLNTVGYGVSQSLPIIVEMLKRTERCLFLIQQPEVHLHPKAQAALGDLFASVALSNSKGVFVETHSDYTIDRFRIARRNNNDTSTAQILFFERRNGQNSVSKLEIATNGSLPEDQPEGYREFFIKEQLNILELL